MRWFAALCLAVTEWLIFTWIFMVIVGIIHADWLPEVPTVGYGFTLLLSGIIWGSNFVRALLSALVDGLTGDGS